MHPLLTGRVQDRLRRLDLSYKTLDRLSCLELYGPQSLHLLSQLKSPDFRRFNTTQKRDYFINEGRIFCTTIKCPKLLGPFPAKPSVLPDCTNVNTHNYRVPTNLTPTYTPLEQSTHPPHRPACTYLLCNLNIHSGLKRTNLEPMTTPSGSHFDPPDENQLQRYSSKQTLSSPRNFKTRLSRTTSSITMPRLTLSWQKMTRSTLSWQKMTRSTLSWLKMTRSTLSWLKMTRPTL